MMVYLLLRVSSLHPVWSEPLNREKQVNQSRLFITQRGCEHGRGFYRPHKEAGTSLPLKISIQWFMLAHQVELLMEGDLYIGVIVDGKENEMLPETIPLPFISPLDKWGVCDVAWSGWGAHTVPWTNPIRATCSSTKIPCGSKRNEGPTKVGPSLSISWKHTLSNFCGN